VLFVADDGVLLPRGDEEPQVIRPAYIEARPAIQLLDPDLAASIDPPRTQVIASGSEWVVIDDALGAQRHFGGTLVPLLRKKEMNFSQFVGIDARGRFIFREPRQVAIKTGATTTPATTRSTTSPATPDLALSDSPTLIIDPTLPDPIPRLPVWTIIVRNGSVGWTIDDWPVMKAGGAWSLGIKDWRSLDEKTQQVFSKPGDVPPPPDFALEHPTTAPTTSPTTLASTQPVSRPSAHAIIAPGEKPLLRDADGNWYFDGKTSLKVIAKDGREIVWPLPAVASGNADPWLVRTPEGLLFLFNQPGRILRIRPTSNGSEPFELEATFSRRIPNEVPTRMWLDPSGRIVIAFSGNQLAVLFPQGYIPPATDRIIPAGEQGVAGDE